MPFFQQFPKTVFDFQNNGIDTTIVDLFRFVKAEDIVSDDLSIYTYYQVRNGDRPDIVSSLLYNTPEYYWTFFILNEQLKSGLSGWPMSTEQFQTYMETEYSGIVITTRPVIVRDGDGIITEYRNSLADRFQIGETVIGSISGATGRLVSTDAQLGQILLADVDGYFEANELIIGQSTSDSVRSFAVYNHAEAPHHYEDDTGHISYNGLFIDESKIYIPGTGYDNVPVDPAVSNSNLNAISNQSYENQLNDERGNLRVVRLESIYDFVKTFKEKLNA